MERFGLIEIKLNKPTWGEYIKLYLKRLKTKMEEDHQVARISDFKLGATQLAKFLTSIYDDLRIFTGRSGDASAAYAYCYMKERGDQVRPHFMFFLDGLTTDVIFVRKSTENSASLIASGRNAYKERVEQMRKIRKLKEEVERNPLFSDDEEYVCEPMPNEEE